MNLKKNIVRTFVLFAHLHAAGQATFPKTEPGISRSLAAYRREALSDISYALDFDIPKDKTSDIHALETLVFRTTSPAQPLQLDFQQPSERIIALTVNGQATPVNLIMEHLLIDQKSLRAGQNEIKIKFSTGDRSLNRNNDYIYALFVPDHARSVFPCFDQPDLKARFLLTLTVPSGWKVLANGVKRDSVIKGDRTTFHFAKSDLLPTYLFSFTAGKYQEVTQSINQRPAEFLYRETDTAKIRLSIDPIFRIHRDAVRFLQNWTGIPFPFQKMGFAAIPDFQFSGMEHPGEVQYNASSLFLDAGATKSQFISRINLISHETAHMWFGDMVSIKWFNDVWMKEVFANFMADKVTERLMGTEAFNLKFLQDHYPAAYGIDRTAGANPIRQQLDNLQDAGSLYGNIIYHKAPIMMRQLELLMGKEAFRKGVQEYLRKYAYGNASWTDLIAILSRHTRINLYCWNQVWVNDTGRPVFTYQVSYQHNRIKRFVISQHPEFGKTRVWPQSFGITFVYPNHRQAITIQANDKNTMVKNATGLPMPSFILFNSDGMGYGLFPVDKHVAGHLFAIKSPVTRASWYITAYEHMLSGRDLSPEQLLDVFSHGLAEEKEETNLKLIIGYVITIYWEFMTPARRIEASAKLEKSLWEALGQQTAANNKKLLFKAYQDVYVSETAGKTIYKIWKNQAPPAGIKLTEDDYTSLALSIALKDDTASHVLMEQDTRIKNEDRKLRLEFMMPALSADVSRRDSFFYSLRKKDNRAKEAWIIAALYYLHHPLRQQTSEKYLPESLELVEELQKTGTIFFPQSWLTATFGNYQDSTAATTVQQFLSSHPYYNHFLKAKILQSTDNLFRARELLGK